MIDRFSAFFIFLGFLLVIIDNPMVKYIIL